MSEQPERGEERSARGLDPEEVCTLPEEGLEARLAWVRSEILPHAISRETLPDGIAWELDDVAGLATQLDRLVELERDCCAGIVFEHRAGRSPGQRRLLVRGVDPEAAVFGESEQPEAPKPVGRRLAGAVGIGALGSLLVCCVLPIAAAALLGAAVAAPLASLDDPFVVLAGALLFGGGAFLWQGRRRAAAASEPGGVSCGPDC